MLIPCFFCLSAIEQGHNPLCVLLSAQSSGMAELEGNIVEQSAWGKTVELYLYMSLALVCAFLYAISSHIWGYFYFNC